MFLTFYALLSKLGRHFDQWILFFSHHRLVAVDVLPGNTTPQGRVTHQRFSQTRPGEIRNQRPVPSPHPHHQNVLLLHHNASTQNKGYSIMKDRRYKPCPSHRTVRHCTTKQGLLISIMKVRRSRLCPTQRTYRHCTTKQGL